MQVRCLKKLKNLNFNSSKIFFNRNFFEKTSNPGGVTIDDIPDEFFFT